MDGVKEREEKERYCKEVGGCAFSFSFALSSDTHISGFISSFSFTLLGFFVQSSFFFCSVRLNSTAADAVAVLNTPRGSPTVIGSAAAAAAATVSVSDRSTTQKERMRHSAAKSTVGKKEKGLKMHSHTKQGTGTCRMHGLNSYHWYVSV